MRYLRMLSGVFFFAAYFVLAAVDFATSLYASRLSRGLTVCAFVFVAVGWDWWFRRLHKKNELIKLNLSAPANPNHG